MIFKLKISILFIGTLETSNITILGIEIKNKNIKDKNMDVALGIICHGSF